MKMTIVLTAVLLSAGTAMAQTPDTTSLGKTPKQWNADSVDRKNNGDSSLNNWQKPAPAEKKVDSSMQQKPATESVTDRVMMRDGAMVIFKDGTMMPLEKEITLPSGTVVQKDGTLKKKDGSEIKLKDGQFIELPAEDKKKPEQK
jgi:hypothetical protein